MDVILKKYLSLIKLLIIFDIFGIFIVGKLDAFWFIRSEKDKAICLERASKEVNEFSAKKTYEYCLKSIVEEKKEAKKIEKEEKKREQERIRDYLNKYTIITESSSNTSDSQIALVPIVCLVTENGKYGVLIVGENYKPLFKEVEIGKANGSNVEIISGIKPGDRIFIDIPRR